MRAIFVGVLALAGACSDAPLCPSDVLVIIRSPTTSVVSDVDQNAANGVQTPVEVRSNLVAGTMIELDVLDGAGNILSSQAAPADATGTATFASVTVPSPTATLHASGTDVCGTGHDMATVDVTAGVGCTLGLTPPPTANTFYAPLGVYTAAADPDPATPGFQATLGITTSPNWTVDVYATTSTGEHDLGSLVADASGVVSVVESLPDGQVSLRASRTGQRRYGRLAGPRACSSTRRRRPARSCTPAPARPSRRPSISTTICSNGVQLAIAVSADGGDVAGGSASVTINPGASTVAMTTLDDSGNASGSATLDPASTPATFGFQLIVQDHAGNTCTVTSSYDVVFDGCNIAVVAPTAAVTVDADGDVSDGSQIDVELAVDPACAGQTVTSSCGDNSPTGIVGADGSVSLRIDACATSPCQVSDVCTFHVSSASGVETTAAATLVFDDQGPAVNIAIVNPAIPCGSHVTAGADVDPVTDGVQVVVRVTAAGAASESLQVTNASGTQTVDASTDVTVTLSGGTNTFIIFASDAQSASNT